MKKILKPRLHEMFPKIETLHYTRKKGIIYDYKRTYKIIDLFSGAGGLTLGFTRPFGFNKIFFPVWANDFNTYAAKTYNANFGDHCTTDDIIDIVNNRINDIPKADVVIGGPPCQGFSLLNKNRSGDPRKQLWRPFFKIVEHTGAKIFIMENVPQLIGSEEYNEIIKISGLLGFKTTSFRLCAADYGVPQTRWRAFIIGCNFFSQDLLEMIFPPAKSHKNPNIEYSRKMYFEEKNIYIPRPKLWQTVRDSIGDLPEPEGNEIRNVPPPLNLHFGRCPTQISLKRYMSIPDEGMNRYDLQRLAKDITPACWINKKDGGTDLFGRLWWDRPAFTIRTEFFKPEKGRYLHPSQHRPITHREAARLQSFPDSFQFIGSKIEIAKQIGNAVPPILAAQVARCVLELFDIKEKSDDKSTHFFKEPKPNNGYRQNEEYISRENCEESPETTSL